MKASSKVGTLESRGAGGVSDGLKCELGERGMQSLLNMGFFSNMLPDREIRKQRVFASKLAHKFHKFLFLSFLSLFFLKIPGLPSVMVSCNI